MQASRATCASLRATVQHAVEYLKCLKTAAAPDEQIKMAQEKLTQTIVNQGSKMPAIDLEVAANCMALVTDSQFDMCSRCRLMELFNSKMAELDLDDTKPKPKETPTEEPLKGPSGGKHYSQSCEMLYNYPTAPLWEELFQTQTSLKHAMQLLAGFCIGKLGLKYPNEPTFVTMVAMLKMIENYGRPGTFTMVNPQQAWDMLNDFKHYFRRLRLEMDCPILGPEKYPTCPRSLETEVPELFKQAYPEGPGNS
eukprot:1057815-Karenia_brevis.AAC.1